jgi:hypothetical protein
MGELRNVTPPGHVVEGFGGRYCDIVLLSFSAIYTGVATVTWCRVLQDLLKIVEQIARIFR